MKIKKFKFNTKKTHFSHSNEFLSPSSLPIPLIICYPNNVPGCSYPLGMPVQEELQAEALLSEHLRRGIESRRQQRRAMPRTKK